ncbi:MAG: DUF5686 family protein, partial [Bacteroidales bacterium]|nr:DUF5686 family protein [Bacteroidales bacterium]
KIITDEVVNYLNITHLNFESKQISVSEIHRQPIFIYLTEKSIELSEVIVVPGINPAHRLIDSLIAHIPENDPKNFNSFSYTIYEKLLVTLESMSDSATAVIQQDTTLQMFQHFFSKKDLFLSENVIERTYAKPDRIYDKVLATRMSGMKEPVFSLLISRLQSFTFYDPVFSIAGKNFINPVSKGSTQKYFFLIQDTTFSEQGDSVFVISFRPLKNTNFDGLEGVLYINQDGWAVQSATASPYPKNEMLTISIDQMYQKIDGKFWFPHQLNADISTNNIEIKSDSTSFPIKAIGRSYFSKITVNQPIKLSKLGEVGVEYLPQAAEKDSNYWSTYRFTPLSEKDMETYRFIDSVGQKNKIDRRTKRLMTLMDGKVKFKFIDWNLFELVDYAKYQGWYLGLGLSTNDDLSRFFSVGGFFGYGFGDQRTKYGGFVDFNLYRPKNLRLSLKYQYKGQRVGTMLLPFQPTHLLAPENYQHFFTNRVDYTEKIGGTISFHPLHYVQAEIGLYKNTQEPSYEYVYTPSPELKRFQFTELNVGLRWAYREEFMKTMRSTVSLGTKYPIFRINYTHGFSHFLGGEFDYNRLDFSIEKKFDIRFLGVTSLTLHGGMVLEDVPYSKLFNPSGTYDYFTLYAPTSFGTMRFNEFANDCYFALFFSHNFKQLLFKPKTKWFAPEPEIITNIGFGWLQHPENHQKVNVKSMEWGYYESGLNINNILVTQFFGIGAGLLYRYGAYSMPNYWDNFAAKLTVSIKLF